MVNAAYINIWGQRAGAVAWDPDTGVASFEYDSKFNLEKWPLAPLKMPQKRRIYTFPEFRDSDTFKGLPGLLADALPDRYGKELINVWLARNGRPEDSLNPVELLCFMGKRGMGALEFEPTLKKDTAAQSLELTDLVEVTKQLLQKRGSLELHTNKGMKDVMLDILKMGTSAGGARPKAIIAYNENTGEIHSGQTTVDEGFKHWIIKFDGVNDAQFGSSMGYGRVEMAYYKMATDFGIEMMESRLIEEHGRAHFMTRRFDRKAGNRKIHIQTFCALQHYDYSNILAYSYEQLFQTMRRLRLDYQEARQMFRRMVFNVIAMNCDDHTKNFAFKMDQDGKWQLAPAYDVCFAYHPQNKWVKQHNLSINGERSNITQEDLITVAKQNSIQRPERIIDECLDVVSNWTEYARSCGVKQELKERIDEVLIREI